MSRPELGDIQPGDRVIVSDPDRKSYLREGTVVKAARVWITISLEESPTWTREVKMRRDHQNEGRTYGYGGLRFDTPEQRAWDVQDRAAKIFLDGQGIRLEPRSPWYRDRLTLANLIADHIAGQLADADVET